MLTNPLSATKEIQENYVNFYKANFTFGNDKLTEKLEKLKENNLLWKSPFISITQNYLQGQRSSELMADTGIDEDVLKAVNIEKFFKHQELTIRNIVANNKNTIISSGTGSGKTESFLIPILDFCVKSNTAGIKAIIVYPMNALANDQVTRLRSYLFKLNKIRKIKGQRAITFGVYNGNTPNAVVYKGIKDPKLNFEYKCPSCKQNSLACRIKSDSKSTLYCKEESDIELDFQLLSRNEIRENPPDILITSYVMLDRMLLRSKDIPLFENNIIKYLVLDEIHAYEGVKGIDVSLLIRRLMRRLSNATANLDLCCIGTSATMSKSKDDLQRKQQIANFAEKLFGLTFTVEDVFEGERKRWNLPSINPASKFQILEIKDEPKDNFSNEHFEKLCEKISGTIQNKSEPKKEFLGKILLENEFFQFLIQNLDEPRSVNEIKELLKQNQKISSKIENFDDPIVLDGLIWSYLKAGSIAENPDGPSDKPLLMVSIHNFFRVLPSIFTCTNPKCSKTFFTKKDKCDECGKIVEELGVCRNCSREFHISEVSSIDLEEERNKPERNEILKLAKNEEVEETKSIRRFSNNEIEKINNELWYSVLNSEEENDVIDDSEFIRRYRKCLDCGSFSPNSSKICINSIDEKICGSKNLILIETYSPKSNVSSDWRPRDCPFCNYNYGSGWAITKFQMNEKHATGNLFNMIFNYVENRKFLVFTDSVQDASEFTRWLDFVHEDTAIKQLMLQKLSEIISEKQHPIGFEEFQGVIINAILDEWYSGDFEPFDRTKEEFTKKIIIENASKSRLSLERLGLIQYNYRDLEDWDRFKELWKQSLSDIKPNRKTTVKVENILELTSITSQDLNKFITTILNMIRTEEAITGLDNRVGESMAYAHGFKIDVSSKVKKVLGETKNVSDGIKIHNIIQKRIIRYTKKVFDLTEDEDSKYIIETVWNFMKKRSYIIPRGLKRYKTLDSKEAHVVSTSKLLVSIPDIIQTCPECKNNFMNLPNNKCRNFNRQKICLGKTNQELFDDFCKKIKENHFFKQFKETLATRMSVREHTAMLSEEERNKIQIQFNPLMQKDRKVDVVVATPTLELGVDIDDLSTVCLYRSPPSPARYMQRVGRAGRKTGVSFINTFFFTNPIDEFYYKNPQDLIKGNFTPPPIKIENNDLVDKHLNALILEQLIFSDINDILSKKVNDFLGNRKENIQKIKMEIKNREDVIIINTTQVLNDIESFKKINILEHIKKKLDSFEKRFNDSIENFEIELKHCTKKIDDFITKGDSKDFFDTIRLQQLFAKKNKLMEKYLIDYLFDVNFLPGFGFPGSSVIIEDMEGTQMHGGRPRQIAIVECAPNCEITYRKNRHKSIGIDLSNLDIESFYICNHCQKFYSTEPLTKKECPFCKKSMDTPKPVSSVAPKKIFIEKTKKALSESNDYREVRVDTFLPRAEYEEKEPLEVGNYSINLKKYGNIKLLLLVNNVYTNHMDPDEVDQSEGQKIEICNKCGRVRNNRWKKHYPLDQKFKQDRKPCKENWITLALHHEMPTNVISIKVDENIENSKESKKSKVFLTTFKNAIMFAGQSICESGEGEIAGVVKDDEIILYDNVDGGAGYVDTIFDRFEEVLERAKKIIDYEYITYGDSCDYGCLRCLWSYRNKRDIKYINKKLIMPLLEKCSNIPTSENNSFGD